MMQKVDFFEVPPAPSLLIQVLTTAAFQHISPSYTNTLGLYCACTGDQALCPGEAASHVHHGGAPDQAAMHSVLKRTLRLEALAWDRHGQTMTD